MKLEMGSYIEDVLGDVIWHMKLVSFKDPYFRQLSLEKFTLETLLQEISNRDDATPIEIVEEFAQKAFESANESQNPNSRYLFSILRDSAMSILDGQYFNGLEERF